MARTHERAGRSRTVRHFLTDTPMYSFLASAVATRYGPALIEATSGPARGAEKIKVGTTLTLIFRPRPDQSWYSPHFDFSRAERAGLPAFLTLLFLFCARTNRPRSPSLKRSSNAGNPYFGQPSPYRPAEEAAQFPIELRVNEHTPMKTATGSQSSRSPLECPSNR